LARATGVRSGSVKIPAAGITVYASREVKVGAGQAAGMGVPGSAVKCTEVPATVASAELMPPGRVRTDVIQGNAVKAATCAPGAGTVW
jgi:hypothetical protein